MRTCKSGRFKILATFLVLIMLTSMLSSLVPASEADTITENSIEIDETDVIEQSNDSSNEMYEEDNEQDEEKITDGGFSDPDSEIATVKDHLLKLLMTEPEDPDFSMFSIITVEDMTLFTEIYITEEIAQMLLDAATELTEAYIKEFIYSIAEIYINPDSFYADDIRLVLEDEIAFYEFVADFIIYMNNRLDAGKEYEFPIDLLYGDVGDVGFIREKFPSKKEIISNIQYDDADPPTEMVTDFQKDIKAVADRFRAYDISLEFNVGGIDPTEDTTVTEPCDIVFVIEGAGSIDSYMDEVTSVTDSLTATNFNNHVGAYLYKGNKEDIVYQIKNSKLTFNPSDFSGNSKNLMLANGINQAVNMLKSYPSSSTKTIIILSETVPFDAVYVSDTVDNAKRLDINVYSIYLGGSNMPEYLNNIKFNGSYTASDSAQLADTLNKTIIPGIPGTNNITNVILTDTLSAEVYENFTVTDTRFVQVSNNTEIPCIIGSITQSGNIITYATDSDEKLSRGIYKLCITIEVNMEIEEYLYGTVDLDTNSGAMLKYDFTWGEILYEPDAMNITDSPKIDVPPLIKVDLAIASADDITSQSDSATIWMGGSAILTPAIETEASWANDILTVDGTDYIGIPERWLDWYPDIGELTCNDATLEITDNENGTYTVKPAVPTEEDNPYIFIFTANMGDEPYYYTDADTATLTVTGGTLIIKVITDDTDMNDKSVDVKVSLLNREQEIVGSFHSTGSNEYRKVNLNTIGVANAYVPYGYKVDNIQRDDSKNGELTIIIIVKRVNKPFFKDWAS